MAVAIEPHNAKPAAVWSCGGARYDDISRGIADSIEHCVLRLNPQSGERVLDLATGTGWTSRLVARRGTTAVGIDSAGDLIAAAQDRAEAESLAIEYQLGDAENLAFPHGAFDAVVSTCVSSEAPRITASRAARRRGKRSSPATGRPNRWPRAWTTAAAANAVTTSSHSMTVSRTQHLRAARIPIRLGTRR
jgi:2-polyprenyl-3-methyl-5-hydroxy-6-metoxy-1,4-benzoquinol methylase